MSKERAVFCDKAENHHRLQAFFPPFCFIPVHPNFAAVLNIDSFDLLVIQIGVRDAHHNKNKMLLL